MATSRQTIRVFISSTFRDMHAERDHLVTVVFPELRERLERLGLDFYDVDLRWGVPETGVDGETANSWAYCKKWIDRVEPFFIAMVGERYGWVPSAAEIDDEADRGRFEGRSITEMEIHHAVLERDTLYRRSFFYLREPMVPLPPATDERIYQDFVDVGDRERLAALKQRIVQSKRPVRHYPCAWAGDYFEDLDTFGRLVLEDLWSGVLRDPRYVPVAVWREVLGHDPEGDPAYADESNPIPQEIVEKLVARAHPEPKDPLAAEAEEMAAFGRSRLRWFQGRREELNRLLRFGTEDLPSGSSRLLIVKGPPGTGKSSLLARFVQEIAAFDVAVLEHYVGATEGSAGLLSMLLRLNRELDRLGIAELEAGVGPGDDLETLQRALSDRLRGHATGQLLIIVLDGVNQLTGGHELRWLPSELGRSVRIVLSCVDDPSEPTDSPENRVLSALAHRRPELPYLSLAPLDTTDVRSIVVDYLREYCKELDREQIERICSMPQARNPLYLLVMLGELRTLGGDDMNTGVPELIARMTATYPDTVSLFDWVLERLEVFGRKAVEHWCVYLALGREGMSSRELRELLEVELGEGDNALRIERSLRRYLQQRGQQLDFFHGQLRSAVRQRYVPPDVTSYHATIATHFSTRWQKPYLHALRELPYHQVMGAQWKRLEETLCEVDFVETKAKAGMVYTLIEDYALADEMLPDEDEGARRERERQDRMTRYARELRERVGQDPAELTDLSAPRSRARTSTLEHGDDHPSSRRDSLRAWGNFVAAYAKVLSMPDGSAFPIAYGYADSGPVVEAMEMRLAAGRGPRKPWLRAISRPKYEPHPACVRTVKVSNKPAGSIALSADGRIAVVGEKALYAPSSLWVVYLDSGETRELFGHTLQVHSVDLTPDAAYAVSGSGDKTVRFWEIESGESWTFAGHEDEVQGVVVLADGSQAASVGWDGCIRVWGVERRELQGLVTPGDRFFDLGVSADGRMIGGCSLSRLVVWEVRPGRLDDLAVSEPTEVTRSGKTHVSLTANGQRIVAGEYNGLSVWDRSPDWHCKHETHGSWYDDYGVPVAVTHDGRHLISGSWRGHLSVWDVETGEHRELKGGSWIESVAVTPDGSRAVSGHDDGSLRVWDLVSGESTDDRDIHAGAVDWVSRSADRSLFVSAKTVTDLLIPDHKEDLRGWDGVTGAPLWSRASPGVRTVSLLPEGEQAVLVGDTVGIWDSVRGDPLQEIPLNRGQAGPVNKNGVLLVRHVEDLVSLYHLPTRTYLRAFDSLLLGPEGSWVLGLAIGPDGRTAALSHLEQIRIWDLSSGKVLRDLPGPTPSEGSGMNEAWFLEFTTDGCGVISISKHRCLEVWNANTGDRKFDLSAPARACAVTADGRRGVSWADHILTIWDARSGAITSRIDAHSDDVTAVTLSLDCRTAVSAGRDGAVRVWDIASGECIAAHHVTHAVTSLSDLGPDGVVAYGTAEGRVGVICLENVEPSIPQVTAIRWFRFTPPVDPEDSHRGSEPLFGHGETIPGAYDEGLSFHCPWCGRRSAVTAEIMQTVTRITRSARLEAGQSLCWHLPDDSWDESQLVSECPHCSESLRFNPFVVDGSRASNATP